MSDDPPGNSPADIPMPREFHSEYEGRPFQNCSRCGESLEAFEYYQINKAFRAGECIFEYVFCATCRDAMLDEFSEESKANLLKHQEKHLRSDAHDTAHCGFCGCSRSDIPQKDFTITALGQQNRLLDSLLICFDCQSGMHELLSQHTRDVRRRFFEELPGVPPDGGDEFDIDREIEKIEADAMAKSSKKIDSPSPAFVGILGVHLD